MVTTDTIVKDLLSQEGKNTTHDYLRYLNIANKGLKELVFDVLGSIKVDLLEVSDALRPQSTSRFNKILAKTYERNFHPLQNVACKTPLRTRTYEPSSTRAELQNGLFQQRYINKNVNNK